MCIHIIICVYNISKVIFFMLNVSDAFFFVLSHAKKAAILTALGAVRSIVSHQQ